MYDMEVTDVLVNPVPDASGPTMALARIVLNGCFAITGIKVVRGKFGPFISFPRFYDKAAGKGYNLCYPITKALQEHISEKVLREFRVIEGRS